MISDHSIAGLPPLVAYGAWRLRQQVFMLEQACLYPDLDGRDLEPGTRHVVLTDHDGGGSEQVSGYLRVLDDGDVWRIGRVVLAATVRGRGLVRDPRLRAGWQRLRRGRHPAHAHAAPPRSRAAAPPLT